MSLYRMTSGEAYLLESWIWPISSCSKLIRCCKPSLSGRCIIPGLNSEECLNVLVCSEESRLMVGEF